MIVSVDVKRLRWRCRRGTTELDRLLCWYLDQRYLTAEPATRTAFATLLDAPDPQLWDWITGCGAQPDNPLWRNIINAIRTEHRL